MENLLDKTRAIKDLLLDGGGPDAFEVIVRVLSKQIGANVYLIGRRGKILGYYFLEDSQCEKIEEILNYSERFPESYNRRLLSIMETQPNLVYSGKKQCLFAPEDCPFSDRFVTIIPIYGGGERLGNMLIMRMKTGFTVEELFLAEYGALTVGMEVMRLKAERAEMDTRKRASVQIALSTLSFSEIKAAEHVFRELGGCEGVIVASRVADRAGITRSVIVNALRKLESAGVIKAKSLGMKGTYITIINENLLSELKNQPGRKGMETI